MEAILAVNKLGAIGLNGSLPWRCSADLKHFKKLTIGKTLLVGRKTYESLPNLPNRKIVVVGKGFHTLEEALKLDIDFVIGGANIYKQTLSLCDVIHVSLINDLTDGDTYFSIPDKVKEKCIYYEFETNK